MRGVYSVRANEEFEAVFEQIDGLLDGVPSSASHLLMPEANILHFLRAIRFRRTETRGGGLLLDRSTIKRVRKQSSEPASTVGGTGRIEAVSTV